MSGMPGTRRVEVRAQPTPAGASRRPSLWDTSGSRFMVESVAKKTEQLVADASYTEVAFGVVR